MSAYDRGNLSVEAYLVRILSAMCRQAGGELRVKGELIDAIGEPTVLLKYWDSSKQELVIQTSLGSFNEVFRVVPEKPQARQAVLSPDAQAEIDANHFTPKSSTVDNPNLVQLERKRQVAQAAAIMRDELERRKRQSAQGELL